MSADIEFYESVVEDLIATDSNKAISNGKPEHAAVLFYSFLKHAKEDVIIYCENLSSKVFGEERIAAAAAEMLDNTKVRLRIITQKDPEPTKFLAEVRSRLGRPNVSLLESAGPDLSVNFTVVDGRRYRYEKDRTRMEAVACMNNPELARALTALFEAIELKVGQARLTSA